ncbi:hypothetical protein DFH07DRAFT_752123 [Mycena maculata]|uniref:Vacuolar import and degradation protein 21 n=1 Tax=Mycena maculata TaxID=230809 RepID=A0AAD7IBZ4_9AGAR|nr:hypothetical protein DFH07DRAFT_752123 [Mycena maculata]
MEDKTSDALVEERVAQLQVISQRRNALLRQMFHMVQRRHSAGSIIKLEEEDDNDELAVFLDRFDLAKKCVINYLQDPNSPKPPIADKTPSIPVSRASSIPSQHPPPESDDELDLIGTPAVSIKSVPSQSRAPSETLRVIIQPPLDGTDSVPIVVEEAVSEDQHEAPALSSLTVDAEGPFHVQVAAEEATKVDVASPEVDEAPTEPNDMVVDEDLFSVHDLTPPPATELAPAADSPVPAAAEPADSIQETDLGPSEHVVMGDVPVQVEGPKDELELANDTPTQMVRPETPLSDAESMVLDEEDEGMQAEPQPAPSGECLPPDLATKFSTKESTPQPIVMTAPPLPVFIREPTSTLAPPSFDFSAAPSSPILVSPETPVTPPESRHGYRPTYTLPPLKSLPADFSRKTKPAKQPRKHKEREKNSAGDKAKDKDDWAPLGVSRWGATLRANPVHLKVSRAPKCLNSREWSVAMAELRLIRTLEQVELLKDAGRWSFRQPKKQRGVGGLTKTHWDYVMDEMKWMRIDFREERKWKLALAYNLSTAVLEWHCFGSLAERVAKGICVGWRRPRVDVIQEELMLDEDVLPLEQPMDVDIVANSVAPVSSAPSASLLAIDYGSEDDDDDEQDKQSVVDALEPSSILDDALDAAEKEPATAATDSGFSSIEFNRGDDSEEPPSALSEVPSKMDVDEEEKPAVDGPKDTPSGLKDSSGDPVFSQFDSISTLGDTTLGETTVVASSAKASAKANIYAPLREYLAYSGTDKLFLDLHDLDRVIMNASADELSADPAFPPTDLSEIFPDLPPLGMLDVAPPPPANVLEGKVKKSEKRDRDDPNKRMEDTMYTKLFPIGKFMYTKPTLIGPLQPAKRWKNGRWLNADDCPASDPDTPPIKPEDSANELFNAKFANAGMQKTLDQIKEKEAKEKETPRRAAHIWTVVDDNLLKALAEKYPNNWTLIAECYNSARLTISIDKRSPRDCQDRWKERWAPELTRPKQQEPATSVDEISAPPMTPTPPTPTPSMTTRGIKRLASVSVSGPQQPASGSDAKKRRRHQYVQETMRKAAKKRAEQTQKLIGIQRKPPAIHETHAQYSRLPKYSPAELSRMKAEKDYKDQQDLIEARRKHEAMTRQQLQQLQAVRLTAAAAARNQVNISQQQQHQQQQQQQQQQRIASPMAGQRGLTAQQQQQQHLLQQQARMQQQQQQTQQAQQVLAHQQALLAQAGGGPSGNANVGVRAGTSSPRPPTSAVVPGNALPRQSYSSVNFVTAGLQHCTPEQLQNMVR